MIKFLNDEYHVDKVNLSQQNDLNKYSTVLIILYVNHAERMI